MSNRIDLTPDPNLDLVLTRVVDVPPKKVWTAWTDPEHLSHWFVPKPWRISHCEIDLRPGGIFRTVMEGPGGEKMDNAGCYLEVVPNERLVWTDALGPGFRPSAQPFMSGAIILEPHQGGTRYTAIALHRDVEIRKQHEEMGFQEGWGTVLDQLVEYVNEHL